jgi:DNA replication and repair protein RecF
VLSGDNGQGKTNLLEAIYVAGTLRSFRAQRLAELVAFGTSEAYVGARVHRAGLERVYELWIGDGARRIRLDGKPVRPVSKYFGDFNVVLFAPEDLRIPRGSPADRRRFLDRAVFNWRPPHLADAQAYEKVLRSRNALLRGLAARRASPDELLEVYDDQLAELGARIVLARRRYLAAIVAPFRSAFASITRTGLEVGLRYVCPEEIDAAGDDLDRIVEAYRELVTRHRATDLRRGASSVGPHRDDFGFEMTVEGEVRSAHAYASQGQLRALVLAWKTAEMDLLTETHGDPPVLLLDDVSSELDATRNQYLFEFLRERRSQCVITTTHPRHVLLEADRLDFKVDKGLILQCSSPPK